MVEVRPIGVVRSPLTDRVTWRVFVQPPEAVDGTPILDIKTAL